MWIQHLIYQNFRIFLIYLRWFFATDCTLNISTLVFQYRLHSEYTCAAFLWQTAIWIYLRWFFNTGYTLNILVLLFCDRLQSEYIYAGFSLQATLWIYLRWFFATGYTIQERSSGGDWAQVNNFPVKEPNFTVMGLQEGTVVEFRVAAVNDGGPGKFSKATPPHQVRDQVCKYSLPHTHQQHSPPHTPSVTDQIFK